MSPTIDEEVCLAHKNVSLLKPCLSELSQFSSQETNDFKKSRRCNFEEFIGSRLASSFALTSICTLNV